MLPKSKKDAEDQCLMNQQLHRIAFCAGISKNLYIMIKRAGSGASAGKFKCHGFTLDSEAQALEITKLLSRVTNEAYVCTCAFANDCLFFGICIVLGSTLLLASVIPRVMRVRARVFYMKFLLVVHV